MSKKRDRSSALRAWDATVQERRRLDREPVERPGGDEPRVQLNAQVPASLRNRFKAKAATEGRTMSEIVTEWVLAYLER